jgi:hypothetical protein
MTRAPVSAAAVFIALVAGSTGTRAQPRPVAAMPAAPGAAASAPLGRHPEEGRPFVRAYLPEEVGGANQN